MSVLLPIALALIAFVSGWLAGSSHAIRWCIELYWSEPAREHAARHGFSGDA